MEDHLLQSLRLFKFFVFGLAATITTYGCSEKTPEQMIKGGMDAEILNLQDSTLKVYSELLPLDYIQGKTSNFQQSITVDSNGIFMFPYEFSEGYYFIEYDGLRMKYFIQKDKRLSLDFDVKKPTQQPEFSGKLKYESRYLFQKHEYLANFQANEANYYSLAENEFMGVVGELRKSLDTLLVRYITNRPVGSPYFMKQEALSNLYYTANLVAQYPIYHQKYSEETTTLSDTFWTSIEKLSLNDTNARYTWDYYHFLQNRVWTSAGEPSSVRNVLNQMQFVDSAIFVPEYRDYLLFQTALDIADWKDTTDQKLALDTVFTTISNSAVREFLRSAIADTTSIPSENQPEL